MLWRLSFHELAWAVQAPLYAAMLFLAPRHAPIYALAIVAYIIVVIVATWPRFPQMTVPQFLSRMQNLSQTNISKDEPEENGLMENGNESSQA